MADRLVGVVAPPERHGAAERLQVIPPAAGGTGVNQHLWVAAAKLVPVGQITGDVLDLRDPLAVRRVGRAPKSQRVHVEVLAVDIDAFLGQELVDVLGQPLPCGRIAEVQQTNALLARPRRPVVGVKTCRAGGWAGFEIPVAPGAGRVLLGAEVRGGVVNLAGGGRQADFQPGGIADMRTVSPAGDEIQMVSLRQADSAFVLNPLRLAAEIDRAVEHRPAGVEHVNVGGRASVDRQERRSDRVGAGLSGREADRAVFALGAGMEGQAARFPADVGHRPRLR